MRIFGFLIVVLAAFSATASDEVVRIDLSACGLENHSTFSGWMTEIDNESYVITSSWAQMTLSDAGCEKVWSLAGPLSVKPLGTDHLAGLSLYKVASDHLKSEMPRTRFSNSANIRILSASALENHPGQIVIARSRRHTLPLWERVLEWQGEAVTSAVLGAPVWKDEGVVGIVSHQYLELVPGAQTRIRRWNLSASAKQNHLVAIVADDVREWARKFKSQPLESVVWRSADQRAGIDRWLVGNLILTSQCPRADDPNPGGQYPIGGNDGFGIGGDSADNKACQVEVENSLGGQAPWIATSLRKWAEKNQEPLKNKESIQIWYGVAISPPGLAKEYFYSVESLVKASLKNEMNFSDVQPKRVPPPQQMPFVKAGKNLQAEALECYQKLFVKEQNVQELVRKLFFYSLLSQGSSWQLLSTSELNAAIDPQGFYGPAWKTISWIGVCGPKLSQTATVFSNEHGKIWQP